MDASAEHDDAMLGLDRVSKNRFPKLAPCSVQHYHLKNGYKHSCNDFFGAILCKRLHNNRSEQQVSQIGGKEQQKKIKILVHLQSEQTRRNSLPLHTFRASSDAETC